MQPFFLCWMFDSRWLCKIRNCCLEFSLVIPITFNIVFIMGMFAERFIGKVHQINNSLYICVVASLLLALTCLILLMKIYRAASNKLKLMPLDNFQAIKQLVHQNQIKQGIWSWFSVLITVFSIVSIIGNLLYLQYFHDYYACYFNQIKFWVDLVCWGIIMMTILFFMIFKGCYLTFAWKMPANYLRYKKVIM